LDYDNLKSKNVINNKNVGGGVVKDGNEFATYGNICQKCGYDKA